MTDEIQKVLVLSTGHITGGTAELLDLQTDDVPIVFDKGGYGWWVHIFEEGDPSTCPADLKLLLDKARSLDCEWLCLDQDGPVDPALPTFEW